MSFSPRFVKLSEVTTLRNGAGIKQENFTDESGGIPLVKVSNFTQNSIDMSDLTMVTYDHAQKWKSHVIQKGNVLIATVGSWPPNWSSVVGKVVRAPENSEGSIQNQNTCCLMPTEELHEGYLYYKLKDPKFLEWVVNIAQGSANQARVPVKKLGEYCFELPSMEIQISIANALEALDSKISNNNQTNQTLEKMAQAIFKSWFVDFDPVKTKMRGEQPTGMDAATASLFPEKLVESELGLIPEGWGVGALSDLMDFNPKRTLKKGTIAPYLDMKNMPTTGHLALDIYDREMGSGTKFMNGDSLLARITPCLENGKSAYVDFLKDDQVGWGSTEYIVMRSKSDSYKYFSYYMARFEPFRKFAIQSMTGTSGRQRAQAKTVETMPFAIPPIAILEKFDAFVASNMQIIKSHGSENKTLATLRDTLLPKLLSGEIDLGSEIN